MINKGDDVEIVGLGATFKTTLTGIGMCSFACTTFATFETNYMFRDVPQRIRSSK